MGVVLENHKEKHEIVQFSFVDLDESKGGTDFQPFLKTQIRQPEKKESADFQAGLPIKNESEKQNKNSENESVRKRDELIETLIQKSEVLTNEIAGLRSKLDNQEQLFQAELKSIKHDSYQRGVHDGILQAERNNENKYHQNLERLSNSMKKLETISTQFESLSENFEKELVHTSIAIAKEVLTGEISFNSGQVAINLSKSLIKNLNEATEITIHANSGDIDDLKTSLSKMENIKIVSDSAISRGGVIISSDIGTIEGNIMDRFKVVKESILSKVD
jgi:flagellar assembly protein FliH